MVVDRHLEGSLGVQRGGVPDARDGGDVDADEHADRLIERGG